MIADAILDMLASACVAPPLRWLWARYWPGARAYLRDLFDGFEDPGPAVPGRAVPGVRARVQVRRLTAW